MSSSDNWDSYPETVRSGDKAAQNCFYSYGDAKLTGGDNWLAWSDIVQNDLDVFDYWKFFDGSYPRPPDLIETKELVAKTKRSNQQVAWDREARQAHHYLKKTIHQDQWGKLVKMRPIDPVGAWNLLNNIYRPRKATTVLLALKNLIKANCLEGSDVADFVTRQETSNEEISRLGEDFPDKYFALLLLSGLPPSWETWRSTIFARFQNVQDLQSTEISALIREENDRRKSQEEEDVQLANIARSLPTRNNFKDDQTQRPELDVDGKCYNCHKAGHGWTSCWSTGGGSYGKGSRQKNQKKIKGNPSQNIPRSSINPAISTANEDDEVSEVGYVFSTIPVSETNKHDIKNTLAHTVQIIADTGASIHVVPSRNMLINFQPCRENISGIGGISTTSGTGDAVIETTVGNRKSRLILKNAKWVPTLNNVLLSVGRFTSSGGKFDVAGEECRLMAPDAKCLATGTRKHNIYFLNGQVMLQNTNHVVGTARQLSWDEAHRKLGHISLTSMKKLVLGDHITGLSINPKLPAIIHCDSCRAAKATRLPFNNKIGSRSSSRGECFHTDLWGPSSIQSLGGRSYFISFTDDMTRYTTIEFLRQKSDAINAIKNHIAWIRTQTGQFPKSMRSDNGGEFMAVSKYL